MLNKIIEEELKKLAEEVLIELIKLTEKGMDLLGFSEEEKEQVRLVNVYSMVVAFVITLLVALQLSFKNKAIDLDLEGGDKNVGG